MVVPEWVETALDEDLSDDEEIVEVEELEDGKLAIVSTSKRGFLVKDRVLFSPKTWAFELTVPAGSQNGQVAAEAQAEPTSEVTTSREEESVEPLPEALEETAKITLSDAEGPFGRTYPLLEIEGIGEVYEDDLEALGLEDTQDLWRADTGELAEALDTAKGTVARWQRMAELMVLDGIGPQYAEVIARAGIDGIEALAETTPYELVHAIEDKEEDLLVRIQGNTIKPGRATGWINAARENLGLDPIEVPSEPDAPATTLTPTLEARVGAEDLTYLDGIGEARKTTLAEHGIGTFEDLAHADPEEVVEGIGVSIDRVHGWQKIADLTQIHGIGAARETALRKAGVQTITALAEVDTDAVSRIVEVPESTVHGWKDQARRLTEPPEDLTEIDGIGETRAEQLYARGVTTFLGLVSADPSKVADELGVGEDTVVEWQKLAVEHPGTGTDLLGIPGVGAARARELIHLGLTDRETFTSTAPGKIAEGLRVSPDTVEGWQAAAEDEDR